MKGVKYKPMRSERMLLKNMGIYGAGGVIVPLWPSRRKICVAGISAIQWNRMDGKTGFA